MRTFSRRLRPDHLAGQIAIAILVSIILFHVVVTIAFEILDASRKPPEIGHIEFAASYVLALDLAPLSDRPAILADLAGVTRGRKLMLRDDRPAAASHLYDGEIDALRGHLWRDAEVFAVAAPGEDAVRSVAVALRKGGYVVIGASQRRGGPSFGEPGPPRGDGGLPPGPPHGPSTGIWIGSALFFFFCAAILTIWTSSAVVAPLVKLAGQAEKFPNENGERELIAEEGPQEVRDLTRSLNRMQDRIYSMIAARSRVLAAISHDLRTIITRMRLRAEFIEDDALRAKMLHDADLMDSMLYKNLLYLRDERYRQAQDLVDLDSVLQTVADQFSDLGHDVTYEGGGRHMIIGSLTDMQRVFTNLVENAAAHAKSIAVSVERPSPTIIQVDVADDGPGICAEDKSRVLEPFVRGQPGRNVDEHGGFGLGLSIVRSLVEEAGGALQLLDRQPHGLIARVTLPPAIQPQADEPKA